MDDIFVNYKQRVYEKILLYLDIPSYDEILMDYQEIYDLHWNLISDYPNRGGKYIRSLILLLVTEAMGCDINLALQTAAAMELSHNWLLIHDDIMDGSSIRRGKKTLQKEYSDGFAINGGDALHIIMWRILRDNEKIVGADKTFRIIDEFIRILNRTTFGQSVELWFDNKTPASFMENDYYFIVDGKTSCYTIAGPMRLGTIIADNNFHRISQEIFPQIDQIGKCFGRAFQIIDDVLNITSDFDGLKEKKGSDIYEGKRTLILSHLVNNTTEIQKKEVCAIYEKPRENKTRKDVENIFNLIAETGSIDYAVARANEWSRKGFELLTGTNFLINLEAKERLYSLLDLIVTRSH